MRCLRLRQLRQARGLSLEALAARMGHIVTKQALSKYEQGKASPSPRTLISLAEALGVKASHLCSEPSLQVRFIAYRRGSGLLKRDQARIESLVMEQLEARVRLQDMLWGPSVANLPVQALPVATPHEAEEAAVQIRQRWNLGTDPICSMTGVLEDRSIQVVPVEASDRFDGVSAVAYEDDRLRCAAIVVRRGLAGERQRLDLAHELGHLVLRVDRRLSDEDAAFRFGAAFLAPASLLLQEVGTKRSALHIEELLLLKRRFGLSLQALVRRLRDLEVISSAQYRQWFMVFNRLQWRKKEPMELPPEEPKWLQQNALHALAEGLLAPADVEAMGIELGPESHAPITDRRALMALPLGQRRPALVRQAEEIASYYEATRADWADLQGGDVVDYAEQISQAR